MGWGCMHDLARVCAHVRVCVHVRPGRAFAHHHLFFCWAHKGLLSTLLSAACPPSPLLLPGTQVSAAALALFSFGQEQAQQRGLLLVDTKYEFGKDSEGKVRLIDEVGLGWLRP